MKNLLVTGGNGFVAQALFPKLISENWKIRTTLRDEKNAGRLSDEVEVCFFGDLEGVGDWKPLLADVDVVIHLAARVHQMADKGQDLEWFYQKSNVELTKTLAEKSVQYGVERFVFISSIKAMGEETKPGKAWNESSPCKPQDAYGRSKHDAEKSVMDIALKTGLEVVILRLPLIYGPAVKANMARLFSVVDRGVPLPLAGMRNARSMLYAGNLVDAIRVSLDHSEAAGQTFLVSDGEDVSTPELIRRTAYALGVPARLFPFSPALLRLAGKLTGKSETVDRLLNSLVIDSSKIRRELDWKPPYSMDQGLKETAEWYKTSIR